MTARRLLLPDGTPPADSFVTYNPTTVPGGRTPHAWLDRQHAAGGSLFDRLGRGFTLLRLGPKPPAADGITAAAARLNIPLTVLDVQDGDIRGLYERDLVLVRPDQHIAWRGNDIPSDCAALLRRLVGGA